MSLAMATTGHYAIMVRSNRGENHRYILKLIGQRKLVFIECIIYATYFINVISLNTNPLGISTGQSFLD
jgi:hypothetical protein